MQLPGKKYLHKCADFIFESMCCNSWAFELLKTRFFILLSIIRSAVVFNMSVNMYVFNNLL